MKEHAFGFLVVVVAGVLAQILATYAINNVRAVRDFTGPL